MGVHSHQPWQQPPAIHHQFRAAQGFEGDPVPGDIQVAFLIVGQDDAAQAIAHPAHPGGYRQAGGPLHLEAETGGIGGPEAEDVGLPPDPLPDLGGTPAAGPALSV